jgi:hypothetical protein
MYTSCTYLLIALFLLILDFTILNVLLALWFGWNYQYYTREDRRIRQWVRDIESQEPVEPGAFNGEPTASEQYRVTTPPVDSFSYWGPGPTWTNSSDERRMTNINHWTDRTERTPLSSTAYISYSGSRSG